jgi:hypothetical protein
MGKHFLWDGYFVLMIILFVFGSIQFIRMFHDAPVQTQILSVAATLLNIWAISGLWCYTVSRPLGYRWQWVLCFFLTFAQLAFATVMCLKVILSGAHGHELRVANLGIINISLGIPLLIALGLYAFRSPAIWHR